MPAISAKRSAHRPRHRRPAQRWPRWRRRSDFSPSCRPTTPASPISGIIAGIGMIDRLVLNLTLLPALLTLLRPPGEPRAGGLRAGRRRSIDSCCAGAARASSSPRCLASPRSPRCRGCASISIRSICKNPRDEAVSTLFDLMSDPSTTPYTIDVLGAVGRGCGRARPAYREAAGSRAGRHRRRAMSPTISTRSSRSSPMPRCCSGRRCRRRRRGRRRATARRSARSRQTAPSDLKQIAGQSRRRRRRGSPRRSMPRWRAAPRCFLLLSSNLSPALPAPARSSCASRFSRSR